MKVKYCRVCDEERDIDDFYADGRGKKTICKFCIKERASRSERKHSEKRKREDFEREFWTINGNDGIYC